MTDALIVDCTTGEEAQQPLTAEEQAEADQRAAEGAQRRQVEEAERTNQATIEERLDAAEAALLPLANSTGTLTSAQLSNAVRLLARAVIGLIKLARRRLATTDGT